MWRRLAAAIIVAVCAPAGAQAPLQLQPIRASEHVYYVQGDSGMASPANRAFNSNAAFVVTRDGVVVFDALGSPVLGAALKAAIASVTTQPVRLVVISHFHADHYYGLQALIGSGVDVWGHANGRATVGSPASLERLEQRRRDLGPDVGPDTRLVGADRWLDFRAGKEIAFERGGVRMRLIDVSGAHSDEDIMLWVENDRVLLAADLYFSGRIPFVGNADSKAWLAAMDVIGPLKPALVVPGHGRASSDPQPDIDLTRAYLRFLREEMGKAARDLAPFDEAYLRIDWSRFAGIPAFDAANRINAYGTYLRMEQEALK